ncbi:hypothetical protein [Amycolatopsis sp. NPDC003861]
MIKIRECSRVQLSEISLSNKQKEQRERPFAAAICTRGRCAQIPFTIASVAEELAPVPQGRRLPPAIGYPPAPTVSSQNDHRLEVVSASFPSAHQADATALTENVALLSRRTRRSAVATGPGPENQARAGGAQPPAHHGFVPQHVLVRRRRSAW